MYHRATPELNNLFSGYPALAAAILRHAFLKDPAWFSRERGAVAFWCHVADVEPEVLWQALERDGTG